MKIDDSFNFALYKRLYPSLTNYKDYGGDLFALDILQISGDMIGSMRIMKQISLILINWNLPHGGTNPMDKVKIKLIGVFCKMKDLPILYSRKGECCGCTACYAICPKFAISVVEDEEGFEYPVIDETKCVRYYMCLKVCPFKMGKAV